MKRLLSGILSAGAVLLALSFSHSAHAAVLNPTDCAAFNYSPNAEWPSGYTTYCSGATQDDQQTMQGGLQLPRSGLFALQKAGVQFFIFGTPAQYQTDFPEASGYPVPLESDFGVTYFDANNVPVFSAIFLVNGNGDSNSYINNTSAYQAARSMDALLGYVNNGGLVVLPEVSLSTTTTGTNGQSNFADELAIDWTTLNAFTPQCEGGGLFTGKQDVSNNYICGPDGYGAAPSGTYAGLGNQAILQAAWPKVFNNGPAALLAEDAAAALMGQVNSGNSADGYLAYANQFQCLGYTSNPYQYLASAFAYGILPSTSTIGCKTTTSYPAFPVYTSASQVFDQSTNYPGIGFMFDGTIIGGHTSDGVAANIVELLDRLGEVGGQYSSPSPLQQKLIAANAYVYLVPNAAAQATLFNNANQPYKPVSTDQARTWPNGNLSFSVVNEGAFTSSPLNQDNVVEVVTHELGHVLENAYGMDSSTDAFELAMQHDWLVFNFVNGDGVTARSPCVDATDGLPAPFKNMTDPISGTSYCPAGVIEEKYALYSNSAILEDDYGYTFKKDTDVAFTWGFNPGVTVTPGRHEWFAEAFAIVAGTLDTGALNFEPFEALVPDGYFQCTAGTGNVYPNNYKGWLYWVYIGQPAASNLPASCTSTLPEGTAIVP